MGITWWHTRWHPALILKLVIYRYNWNDGRAGILRHSLGEVKEKCERRTAPAPRVKMCLYCLWHFHINRFHNEQLFMVVWHSNLSVCDSVCVCATVGALVLLWMYSILTCMVMSAAPCVCMLAFTTLCLLVHSYVLVLCRVSACVWT